MRKLSVSFAITMALLLTGCAGRRVTVNPTAQGQKVILEDRTRDAFLAEFADLEAVLKSDLPAEQKTQLAEKILEKRIEALKELLLREQDKGKNLTATFKESLLFVAALLGITLK